MKLADCCLLITAKCNTVKCFHLLVLLKCIYSLEELFFYTEQFSWSFFAHLEATGLLWIYCISF